MPQVNNQIKNQIKNSPPVHPLDETHAPMGKLLDLPERRSNSGKYVGALLGLIILGLGGYFAYGQFYAPTSAPAPMVRTQPEVEVKTIPDGTNFYLTTDLEDTEVRIYKYSAESSKSDEKIGVIPEKVLRLIGKYIKPYSYVTTNAEGNKLQLLDAATAKLEPLFDLPVQAVVREVAVSADKKYLAYGRTYGGDTKDSSGEIWLYNIETKEQKQLVEKTILDLYQGFSVLGWRDNDREIIVTALGGDAGGVFGDIYQVDVATGKFTKLKNPDDKNLRSFLNGQLSPNADQWLYEFCTQPDDVVRGSEEGSRDACTSGMELRIFDFSTQQTKTVYQNLRYADNTDKSTLRTFMHYVWQDDKTIVAAAPGALLSIPIANPDKSTEIVTYDRSAPLSFKNNPLFIESASPAAIVYSRDGSWHVFDRVSQKLIDINTNDRKERISAWLN